MPEIAFEKAGIIKKQVPVVIGEEQAAVKAVFLEKAKAVNAPIFFASSDSDHTKPICLAIINKTMPLLQRLSFNFKRVYSFSQTYSKRTSAGGKKHLFKRTMAKFTRKPYGNLRYGPQQRRFVPCIESIKKATLSNSCMLFWEWLQIKPWRPSYHCFQKMPTIIFANQTFQEGLSEGSFSKKRRENFTYRKKICFCRKSLCKCLTKCKSRRYDFCRREYFCGCRNNLNKNSFLFGILKNSVIFATA